MPPPFFPQAWLAKASGMLGRGFIAVAWPQQCHKFSWQRQLATRLVIRYASLPSVQAMLCRSELC